MHGNRLTYALASKIVEGALAHASASGLKPLTVAVLDSGGHLLALARQDGSSTLRPQIAIAKASGALGLGISSRQIGAMAAERPSFVGAVAALAPAGLVPSAGGLIIVDGNGHTLGAVGISGDAPDHDEASAVAGLGAAGLRWNA